MWGLAVCFCFTFVKELQKKLCMRIIWESHVASLVLPWCTSVSAKCVSFLWSWQLRHTQWVMIMTSFCHLHVVNINRVGLCVPAPRQSHPADHFSGFENEIWLLSYCHTFLIYTSHILALPCDSLFHFLVHHIPTRYMIPPVIIPRISSSLFNFTINKY